MLDLIPEKLISGRKSRERSHRGVLCNSKFQLMVRHEDYSKQNQNKVPELKENVIICIFYIWLYLIISVEAPATEEKAIQKMYWQFG